jgi:hypothetical protein
MRPGLAAIVARAKLAAMPTPDATPPESGLPLLTPGVWHLL